MFFYKRPPPQQPLTGYLVNEWMVTVQCFHKGQCSNFFEKPRKHKELNTKDPGKGNRHLVEVRCGEGRRKDWLEDVHLNN